MCPEHEGSALSSEDKGIALKRSSAPSPQDDIENDAIAGKSAEVSPDLTLRPDPSETSKASLEGSSREEERPPPLPPRPSNLNLLHEGKYSPGASLHVPKRAARPQLQSTATTALSRTDIHTQSYQDGSRETTASSAQTRVPSSLSGFGSIRRFKRLGSSEGGDSTSIKSYAPTLEAGGDVESLLGEVLGASQESPAWKLLSTQEEAPDPFDSPVFADDELTSSFYREFDEIHDVNAEDVDEGISCNTL